jgi:hypothetical protein
MWKTISGGTQPSNTGFVERVANVFALFFSQHLMPTHHPLVLAGTKFHALSLPSVWYPHTPRLVLSGGNFDVHINHEKEHWGQEWGRYE